MSRPLKPDRSRDPAYRLIAGLDHSHHRRGTILAEYGTAKDLWSSSFIRNYFASFGKSEADYHADYLKKLNQNSIYQLSNLYSIAYCEVTKRGTISLSSQPRKS